MRTLVLIMLLPMTCLSATYKDTLTVDSTSTPADWRAEGDSVVSDLWSNDASEAYIDQLVGDDGGEQHLLSLEDLGGAYSFYGAGATVDQVVLIWERSGVISTGGVRLGLIVGNDTTWTDTSTSTGTRHDTISAPGGRAWDVENLDSAYALIDGEATLGGGEQIRIDYIWAEVTYSTAAVTEGLDARYLNILFDHDSCFTFSGWQGRAEWTICVDQSRTNTFEALSDTAFLWKQVLASKPTMTSSVWIDTFAMSSNGAYVANNWSTTATFDEARVSAYINADLGGSLQRNYTNGNGDSAEYYNGRLAGTGVKIGSTIQPIIVKNSSDDMVNDAIDSLRFSRLDYGIRLAVDSLTLDTITYPVEITVPFTIGQRPLLSYGAIGEGGQFESFKFMGPTGSTLSGYGAWLTVAGGQWPKDTACFYVGLWSNCSDSILPDTIIEIIYYGDSIGQSDSGVAVEVFVPSESTPTLTFGERYWVGFVESRSATTYAPVPFSDNLVQQAAPDKPFDTTHFTSAFLGDETANPPDSVGDIACNEGAAAVITEYKTGWFWISYQEPVGPTFRNGGVYKNGATVRGTQ